MNVNSLAEFKNTSASLYERQSINRQSNRSSVNEKSYLEFVPNELE